MDKNRKIKKKFRQTRTLIKIAQNDGWTQGSIAKTCRTQQSIVSAWVNGEKLASVEAIKPLLKLYGNKLRRLTSRFYYDFNDPNGHKYFKVEGEIVFSYQFMYKNNDKEKPIAVRRIVIHHQNNNKFRIILQSRGCTLDQGKKKVFSCPNEKANWNSEILPEYSYIKVIEYIDNFPKNPICNSRGQTLLELDEEAITFPFLIREAIYQLGYNVEGIDEYNVEW